MDLAALNICKNLYPPLPRERASPCVYEIWRINYVLVSVVTALPLIMPNFPLFNDQSLWAFTIKNYTSGKITICPNSHICFWTLQRDWPCSHIELFHCKLPPANLERVVYINKSLLIARGKRNLNIQGSSVQLKLLVNLIN